jgi:argininosuccinate lyase
MPQKKNPDPLELVRGRAAATAGALAGALGIVHGLPAGYSRDLQEVKPALWLGLRHAGESAAVAALVVDGLTVRPGKAAVILERGYAAALDLAELLSLRHGVPFRKAHFAVGQLVRDLAGRGLLFAQLGAREASEALSRSAGQPVRFTEAGWRDAVHLAAGAARRRAAGGPGDGAAGLREARARLGGLDRAIRVAAARETRARRELARRLGPGH